MINNNILMVTMGLEIGGAETHIVELTKELKKQGFNVIVASNGGVYEKELKEFKIKHYSVPLHNKNPFNVIKSYHLLKDIIRNEKIDIVHAHARIPAFICGKLYKKMNFKFVTTAHWVFKTSMGLKYITDWGEKTIAVSEDIKKYLIDNYNLLSKDILLTINGINTEKFSPNVDTSAIEKEFNLSNTKNRIVYCSRMDGDRSLVASQLLDVADKLNSSIKDLEIIIVGGGNTFDEINNRAEEINKKVNRKMIIMTNARTDVNKFVAKSTVFVGVSRSALEAMAAEKCVVIAGNEGYIGLFDKDKLEVSIKTNLCCRSCEPSTSEKLYEDIMKVFSMTIEEREKLGKYSNEIIKKYYSVNTMANQNIKLYEAVMEKGE